jgi:hypothetical protein
MKPQWMLVSALVIASSFVSTASRAAPAEMKFYGYAYDLKTGQYLYTEVYDEQVENDHWERGRTRYFSTDGKPIGVKHVDFSADPFVPVYTLELFDVGYSEGISKVSADGIVMFKQSREKGRQTASVKKSPVMAADAGFHAFIVANLDALAAGRIIPFRFAVAGQLDAYNFRVRKIGDTEFEGRPAIKLQIEPDSLLRFAVDPLVLTYEPSSKRLLEYRGISNVIDPLTGKPYNVRIVYPGKPPQDAPKNLPPLD